MGQWHLKAYDGCGNGRQRREVVAKMAFDSYGSGWQWREAVWAKPMSVKIHSQDRELISVPYNTLEKKMSAGVTLYFHIILHQPSILLAWIL
jgi:hypothetical protein